MFGRLVQPFGSASFSPASLSLSAWFRAPFSASPWTPTASAGASGANGNLTEATNPPAAGTPLNGLVPATFDGTNDKLGGSTALTTLTAAAAWSLAVLVNPVATAATKTAGAGYTDRAIVAEDVNGSWALTYTTSGMTMVQYDGVSWKDVSVATAAASYHLVQAWYDGVNVNLQVDSGAASTVAAANLVAGGGFLRLGANYTAAAFCASSVAEVLISTTDLGATARANIKTYVNSLYGLAL